ncbi:hypothetical protein [Streptacidiphilus sp. EB129]|uniref:hypothetical protein n=1 Tax=Streptacidiphilus sp. EB129 TaxID=3156262 RepID=UPI00351343B5
MRSAVVALLVILAAVGVGAAARDHRPAPFGDAVVTRGSAPASPVAYLRRGSEGSVELYDPRSALVSWSYRRPGAAPLRLFALAGTTVVVWDDGMLTGLGPALGGAAPTVRWHRFVPGLADWGKEDDGGGPLLAPLDGGTVFLVPTPHLMLTFTTADGTIRADTLPPAGCAYDPSRAVQLGDSVVLPRPCETQSTLDAFGPNGRRWQAPTSPLARPTALPDGSLGLWDVPALHPYRIDLDTGRRPAAERPGSLP